MLASDIRINGVIKNSGFRQDTFGIDFFNDHDNHLEYLLKYLKVKPTINETEILRDKVIACSYG
jgi:hypothetical protein